VEAQRPERESGALILARLLVFDSDVCAEMSRRSWCDVPMIYCSFILPILARVVRSLASANA